MSDLEVRVQRALFKLEAESAMQRMLLLVITCELLATKPRHSRDAWVERLRTLLSDATSAIAADPDRELLDRVRGDQYEAAAAKLMDALQSLLDSTSP